MNDQDDLGLNIQLEDVDTSIPALAPGKVPMQIIKAEITAGKKEESDRYLTLSLKSINPELGTKGETLDPGVLMFFRLALQQHPKAFEDFRKPLARLALAAFGSQRNLSQEFVAELTGKVLLANIKASKKTTYGETEVGTLETYAQD